MNICFHPLSASALTILGCLVGAEELAAQSPKLLEVELRNARIVGLPIHWSRHDAVVLEPDGSMQTLEISEVRRHQILSADFIPQSLADARNRLQAEMGSSYETLISGPYVIAAPTGQTQRWRERFNALLAGYLRYFEVRGWSLRKPDFPLCVMVWSTRREYLSYVASQAGDLPSNVVGSYFPKSNRCVLYQIESTGGTDWAETEATIVHEAVHQLAFNTGIHERLSSNPIWFVEGLASMFEQSAVYDLRNQQSTILSRMIGNKRDRLQSLLNNPPLLEQQLQSLIASDQLFGQDPQLAYDLAWALTFYLAERMPTEFRTYYALLSHRPFGGYSDGQRVHDFKNVFGGDIGLLAIQIQRLLKN